MKNWLFASVAAIAVLGACGGDKGEAAAGAAGQEITVGDVKVAGLQLRSGDASKAGDALTAMSLSASDDGRVGFADKTLNGADATFNDVSISVADSETPVNAGALTFKGLDMTGAGATFSQMTLSDISVTPADEDGELNVGSVQLTNPSPELAAWVAGLMGEGDAPFPSFDKLSFDGFSMDGLTFNADGIDELETFDISKIDFRNVSDEGVGSIVFKGLNMVGEDDGQPINVALGSVAMTGLGGPMMDIIAASFQAGATGEDPEELIEDILSKGFSVGDPGYDNFTLENFVLDAAGLGINMPSMDAVVTRDNQGRATRTVTKPFNFSVSADPEGEVGAQLAGPLAIMGYETLNFSGEGDSRMDPDTDTISYDSKSNWIALDDGFKLSWGASATGASELMKQLAANPDDEAQLLEGLSKLTMQRMDINFQDNSIVEKGFAMAAAMSGQDPAAMKSQAVAGVAFLPLMAGQAGIDAELAAELGGALSKFLNDSGTLSISIDPTEPVSAADFEDPSSLTKDRLGFSASVK